MPDGGSMLATAVPKTGGRKCDEEDDLRVLYLLLLVASKVREKLTGYCTCY